MNTLAQYNNANVRVERGKYARISVEIDLHMKLQSRFVLRIRVFTVEYEGLQVICLKCGQYEHNQEEYSLNNKEKGGANVGACLAGERGINATVGQI